MKKFNKLKFFEDGKYKPHQSQLEVHSSNKRFRIVVAGRRFGKSLLASRECMAWMIKPNQMVWIVAPTYELTKKVFREVFWGFHHHLTKWVKKSSEADLSIELANGSILKCKSADNPVSLLGEGLNFLIIDEASRVPEQVWNEALRPTLTDKKGEVLLISTPQGMNWFQQAFVRGQDPNEKDYQSWQFPSGTNPHLPQDEIAEAKRTLPERVFKQEYLAEFVSDAGTVFRNVDNCIKGTIEEPQPNTRYILGVDLGKFQDFTVIVVLKQEAGHSHIVYFDRFNKIDWNLQKTRIQAVSKRYNNALSIIDSTGVGDAVFTDLSQMRVNVRGFRIKSNEIKCQLIENLIIAIENEEISFQNIPELINELKIFNYEYSEISGKTHYNAPSGFHDDCVIALALAFKYAKATPMIIRGGSKSYLTKFPAEETLNEKIERLKKQWKTNEVTITNG
jgi:hypothetical protein